MLHSKNRLSRVEVNSLKKKARVVQGLYFGLLFEENKLEGLPRFGFIVSRKISKKAVERNLIRRRMKEAVRSLLVKFPPGSYVFLAKQSVLDKTVQELKQELEAVIKKFER